MLPASIDTLKASISRRGGLAKANRYAVYINHPSKKINLINTDVQSLLGNAARSLLSGGSMSLKGFFEDPRDIFLFCEAVTIPGRQIATNEFFTDMKGIKKPYAFINDEVSMTFQLTNDYYMFKYFRSWMDAILPKTGDTYGVAYKSSYCTDIVIQQLGNTDYVPVYGVVLKNAYPTTMSSINLANGSENTVATITITFTCDDWEEQSEIQGIGTGIKTGLSAITSSIATARNIGKLF